MTKVLQWAVQLHMHLSLIALGATKHIGPLTMNTPRCIVNGICMIMAKLIVMLNLINKSMNRLMTMVVMR